MSYVKHEEVDPCTGLDEAKKTFERATSKFDRDKKIRIVKMAEKSVVDSIKTHAEEADNELDWPTVSPAVESETAGAFNDKVDAGNAKNTSLERRIHSTNLDKRERAWD